MVRTTLGAEVDTTVTVSGSESVDFVDLSQTSTLTAGSEETVRLTAQSGTVIETLGFKLAAPQVSAATSGFHFAQLQVGGIGIRALNLNSLNDAGLNYQTGAIQTANNGGSPSDPSAQQQAPLGLRADNVSPITIKYSNQLDVDQTNSRTYQFALRVITVSE